MDFKEAIEEKGKVILKDVKNFELPHIFDCGQCFRWNRQDNNNYIGVAFGRVIEVEKNGDDVVIYNTDLKDFNDIWLNYFDLERDYSAIKGELEKDELLKKAVEFGTGIRILQQDPFEMLISFITSANNRIPMIKRAIENISKTYGKAIEYKSKTYYAFPTLEEFSVATAEDVEALGVGFRAKYIVKALEDLSNGIYNLNEIRLSDDDGCHEGLKNFSGVGPKVADCIMLFSMGKYSAFPVDVWVKRAMQFFYVAPDVSLPKIRQFARDKFGNLSGFAQQYLFYYARENNIKIDIA
ncbi:DNA glycosylase [Clostridium sp. UBA1056]|uniref:DNA-3-methyladenine glycosylase family protein n=1 Tax=unclassified Clostridium TaxID=2614128 RepID=UPI003216FC47